MKKISFLLIAFLPLGFLLISFINPIQKCSDLITNSNKAETISFYVKGNGKFNVELGVADKPGGIGSCCRGVSINSTVGFQGRIGDVLFDSKTKKVITKIYEGLKGKTVDLKDYY